MPKIKDVNHFYLRKGVLMSGYRIFSFAGSCIEHRHNLTPETPSLLQYVVSINQ